MKNVLKTKINGMKKTEKSSAHLLALISSNCKELCLREHKGSEGAPGDPVHIVTLHDMETWLVTVH